MPAFLTRIYIAGLLLLSVKFGIAQKNIVISDSLAANAEKWSVKIGNTWPWKIARFSFGDYTVASSKVGWGTSSSKSNLFGTKTQSKSTKKFSFVLKYKTTDSAQVNTANNILTKEAQPLELFPNAFFGSSEVLKDSNNFSAIITINEDTAETWALFMVDVTGSSVENKYEAFLTNRERNIFLISTTSDKNNQEKRLLPAQGYEFIENGASLCALQYFGGGMLGVNKKTIWMRKDLDAKMKLILAAAMTAVMQVREPSPAPPPL